MKNTRGQVNEREYIEGILRRSQEIREYQSNLWDIEIKVEDFNLTEIQQFMLKILHFNRHIFQNDLALICKPLVSEYSFSRNLKELLDNKFIYKSNKKNVGVVYALLRKGVKALNPFITNNNYYNVTIPDSNLSLYKTTGNMLANEILSKYTEALMSSFNKESKSTKAIYLLEQYIKEVLFRDYFVGNEEWEDVPENDFNEIDEWLSLKITRKFTEKDKGSRIKRCYKLIQLGFSRDEASQLSIPKGTSSIVLTSFMNHFKNKERLSELRETDDFKAFWTNINKELINGSMLTKFEILSDYKDLANFDNYEMIHSFIKEGKHNLLKHSYHKVEKQFKIAFKNIKNNDLQIAKVEQARVKKQYESMGLNVSNRNIEEANDRVKSIEARGDYNGFLEAEKKLSNLKRNHLTLNANQFQIQSILTRLYKEAETSPEIDEFSTKYQILKKHIENYSKAIENLEKQISIGFFQWSDIDSESNYNPEPSNRRAFTMKVLKENGIYFKEIKQVKREPNQIITTLHFSIIDNVSNGLSNYILFKRIAIIQAFANEIDSTFKVNITLHCPTKRKYEGNLERKRILMQKLSLFFQEFAEVKENFEIVLEDLENINHSEFYRGFVNNYREML